MSLKYSSLLQSSSKFTLDPKLLNRQTEPSYSMSHIGSMQNVILLYNVKDKCHTILKHSSVQFH